MNLYMGFNKIMQTIIKFRKFAAATKSDEQIDPDEKINQENLPRFFIDDKGRPQYNWYGTSTDSVMQEHLLRNDSDPLANELKLLMQNRLFPEYIRKVIKTNTLKNQEVLDRMAQLEKKLKINESTYKQYKADIDRIDQIITNYNQLSTKYETKRKELEQKQQEWDDIQNQIDDLNNMQEKINEALDAPADEDDPGYKKRDYYYEYVVQDDFRHLNLYIAGKSLETFNKKLNELKVLQKAVENFLIQYKDKQTANTNEYENAERRNNQLNREINKMALKIKIAKGIVDIANNNAPSNVDEGIEWYDYTEVIKDNNELKKIDKNEDLLPNIDLNDTEFWSWEFLTEIMPNLLNIKSYIDQEKTNTNRIDKLNGLSRRLDSDITSLEAYVNNDKKKLEDRQDIFTQASNIKENINQPNDSIPYKDKVDFITQYDDII